MSLAAVRASHETASTRAARANRAGRMSIGLYVVCVIFLGVSLLVRFTPHSYPNPWLTVVLLCSSLMLSSLKLRLPLAEACRPCRWPAPPTW